MRSVLISGKGFAVAVGFVAWAERSIQLIFNPVNRGLHLVHLTARGQVILDLRFNRVQPLLLLCLHIRDVGSAGAIIDQQRGHKKHGRKNGRSALGNEFHNLLSQLVGSGMFLELELLRFVRSMSSRGKPTGMIRNPTFDRVVNKFWHSLADRFRAKRKKRFLATFPPERFASIIDVGGLATHWNGDVRDVTVLNLIQQQSQTCKVIAGDGRHTGLPDRSFDLAYSNSVIEHVGNWQDQLAFATELRRIGKAVYCQTPNRWFPLEVHYVTFFLHWYPRLLRNYFVARFLTGWGFMARPDKKEVQDFANSVELLSYKAMKTLFPDCEIRREKFLGLTKSLIAIRKDPRRPEECAA